MDREYHAAAETVTQGSVVVFRVAESCLNQVLLGVAFGQSGTCQRIGLIGTVTKIELFKYVITESALAEIGQTYGSALVGVDQGGLKEIQCKLIGDEQ